MSAKGQAAVTKIHVNTGRVTSGRWPTVTPDSYKCLSRAFTFHATMWLKLEVSLKGTWIPAPPFCQYLLTSITSHLLWGPGCYVKQKGNQSGLQEVSCWCFSCVPMVTESVSCCVTVNVSISCQNLSKSLWFIKGFQPCVTQKWLGALLFCSSEFA